MTGRIIMIAMCIACITMVNAETLRGDSLKDIEKDIEILEKEVDKINKSLESLANTIISPEAARIIFYLDLPEGSPLPSTLKIYVNGDLVNESSYEGVKKGKDVIVPLDTYFIPGDYEISVSGSFKGALIKGKSNSLLSLKAGETGKIVISKSGKKEKGVLSVKSIK